MSHSSNTLLILAAIAVPGMMAHHFHTQGQLLETELKFLNNMLEVTDEERQIAQSRSLELETAVEKTEEALAHTRKELSQTRQDVDALIEERDQLKQSIAFPAEEPEQIAGGPQDPIQKSSKLGLPPGISKGANTSDPQAN